MQQLETFRKILETAKLFGKMPSGAGWVTPQEIINWSGVKHSTAYRALPKLEKLGFFHVEEYECRKLKCRRYRITESGIKYLETWNEIPF